MALERACLFDNSIPYPPASHVSDRSFSDYLPDKISVQEPVDILPHPPFPDIPEVPVCFSHRARGIRSTSDRNLLRSPEAGWVSPTPFRVQLNQVDKQYPTTDLPVFDRELMG